jgi:general secretion pathway protein I
MKSRGFTLMEILLALTLVAILVVALGGLSSSQLVAASRADHLLEGELLAENELNRILAARDPIPLGKRSHAVTRGEQHYQVAITASGTDVALIRRVAVVVSIAEGPKQEQRELVSLVGFRGLH